MGTSERPNRGSAVESAGILRGVRERIWLQPFRTYRSALLSLTGRAPNGAHPVRDSSALSVHAYSATQIRSAPRANSRCGAKALGNHKKEFRESGNSFFIGALREAPFFPCKKKDMEIGTFPYLHISTSRKLILIRQSSSWQAIPLPLERALSLQQCQPNLSRRLQSRPMQFPLLVPF